MRIKTNTMQYRDPNTGEFVSIPIVVSEPKEEKFELIESFEVTEELASFVRTAEPDGTPYDFQKIKVIIKQPKTNGNSIGALICFDNYDSSIPELYLKNSFIANQQQEAFSTNLTTYSEYRARIENGVLKGEVTTLKGTDNDDIDFFPDHYGYYSIYIVQNAFSIAEAIRLNNIKYIRYGSLNSHKIPIGTKIQIYAVRS